MVRSHLMKTDLKGDAMAVKVPENILIGFPGIVATSDTAIIDQSKRAVDLAGAILRQRTNLDSLFRLNKKRTPRVHL